MFRYILWKLMCFGCFGLLFHTYGPDIGIITPEKIDNYLQSFSQLYCVYSGETEHVDRCIKELMEQANYFKLLTNETVHSFLDSLKTSTLALLNDITGYFNRNRARKDTTSHMFDHPTGNADGDAITTMVDLIKTAKKDYDSKLGNNYIKEVEEKLGNIAFRHHNTKAFCIMEQGIDPSSVINHIEDIASMTKMPKDMQNILERTISVRGASGKIAKNVPIAVDGVVHYVLLAAVRKANNSFDIGMAVYSVDYQIADKSYQRDEEAVREFIAFSNDSKVDDVGILTFKGGRKISGYFYGMAVEMFMSECPSLLSEFKDVSKDLET